ncbi:unnamed protein product [Caenorhabditis sp. 36 PRJEB53466]|nr:unnamed protein product [Caenorhabditis sp. 36 PRJEB53466]
MLKMNIEVLEKLITDHRENERAKKTTTTSRTSPSVSGSVAQEPQEITARGINFKKEEKKEKKKKKKEKSQRKLRSTGSEGALTVSESAYTAGRTRKSKKPIEKAVDQPATEGTDRVPEKSPPQSSGCESIATAEMNIPSERAYR